MAWLPVIHLASSSAASSCLLGLSHTGPLAGPWTHQACFCSREFTLAVPFAWTTPFSDNCELTPSPPSCLALMPPSQPHLHKLSYLKLQPHHKERVRKGEARGGEGRGGEGRGRDVFMAQTVVMVSLVYMHLQTHHAVDVKCVQLVVCQSYLNKVAFLKKQNTKLQHCLCLPSTIQSFLPSLISFI